MSNRVRALRLGLVLLAAAASAPAGEKRYCATPEEYVRDFEAMLESGSRSEDSRLKRTPGSAMLDAREVEGLLLLLKSERPEAREFACERLGRLHASGALDNLIAALSDRDARVREKAADALGRIGDARAGEPLLKRFTHQDEKPKGRSTNARAAMARSLGRLGEKRAVDPILEALKDKSYWVRLAAIEAAGRLGDARAVDLLMPMLDAKQAEVVARAVRSLGQLKARTAYPKVAALLDHNNAAVRSAVIEALGGLGDPRAVTPLTRILSGENDRRVRVRAARALGELGSPAAAPALRAVLEDKSHDLCAAAAGSLRQLKDPAGMEALRRLFREHAEFSHSHPVASAIAELGDEGFSMIMKGLANPDRDARRLRSNAALATGFVGERCLDASLLQLKSPKRELRQAACLALYHNHSEKSVPALGAALRDPKSGVQREAADALAAIGRPAVPELIAAAGGRDLPAVAAAAAVTLKVRDHRLVPVLKKLLEHRETRVRVLAVFGLGHQYHPEAMPALIAKLDDPEPKVREAVLAVLERNSWARSYLPRARAALKDDSVIVRRKAAAVLRAFGDPTAIPDLQAGLRGEKDQSTVRAMEAAIESINRAEERRKKDAARRQEREKTEAERRKAEEERRRAEQERRKAEEERRAKDDAARKEDEERRKREEDERRRREQEKREKEDPGDEEPL